MRKAEVSMHGIPAGILEEIEAAKKYRFTYFEKSIEQTVSRIINVLPRWTDLIQKCFLSNSMKTQYIELLNERFSKLELTNS
jgi:hypothetical protein